MYILRKQLHFDAAHSLPQLGPNHKCAGLHGHTYTVEVVILAQDRILNAQGMVVDFGKLSSLVDEWDHVNLNDVLSNDLPTVELLAKRLHDRIRELVNASTLQGEFHVWVTVHEGLGASVTFHAGDDFNYAFPPC